MNTFIDKSAKVLTKVRFLDIYMLGHNGYIAGGCFKNIFEGKKIKDIDIFFENENQHTEAVLYLEDNEDYVFSYENEKVKAFKNTKTNIRIELVKGSFGTAQEMLERFDFSIVKFAYYKQLTIGEDGETSTEFVCKLHTDFFEHLMCKKLVLEPTIIFPVSTWERSLRYTKYGYGLCFESKKHLLTAIKESDISDLSNSLYDGID